jgi:hypothetical protein
MCFFVRCAMCETSMYCKKVTDKMPKICAVVQRPYERVLHLALQTFPNSCCSYIVEGPAQVGTEYTYGKLHTYVRGSSVHIRTPAHQNLISRSTTATPPVLSPSSILLSPSSHCTLIAARTSCARPENAAISKFFLVAGF